MKCEVPWVLEATAWEKKETTLTCFNKDHHVHVGLENKQVRDPAQNHISP